MLFWRTKTAKQTTPSATAENPDNAVPPAAEAGTEVIPSEAETPEAEHETAETGSMAEPVMRDASAMRVAATVHDAPNLHDANVITLSSVRLADRLADLNGKAERAETESATATDAATVDHDSRAIVTGQTCSHTALKGALQKAVAGSHVLIVGPAGSGRRAAAVSVAHDIAASRDVPPDWIFAACGVEPGLLKAYAVPHGTGQRMVRDVQDALAKSSAMLARLMASDSHQMSLAVLEEYHRQRSDGGIEDLKRRAESQNIALVRTSEGFVLAPMHEGRVVRSDVFRALPDALQRDVESKISVLEGELQALLGTMPGTDIAVDDRHLALSQQTAERAVKPNLSVARKLFANGDAIAGVFDAIESDWTRRAAEAVRRGDVEAALDQPGLQAICADATDGAPVVVAHAVSAAALLGEIGRDMAGHVAIRPGYLALANGGFLIIDAWRLAADPQAWAALSAALETGSLQPAPAAGLAVTVEPVPLNVTLVLIAERRSLARLKAIDPRAPSYFSSIVSFEAPAKPSLRAGAAS